MPDQRGDKPRWFWMWPLRDLPGHRTHHQFSGRSGSGRGTWTPDTRIMIPISR